MTMCYMNPVIDIGSVVAVIKKNLNIVTGFTELGTAKR